MTQNKLLDKTDRKLLTLLQEQGRIKRGELAEAVKMSIPSVSGRIERLQNAGVIRGYHTVLNPNKIGLTVIAFVTIQIDSSTHYPEVLDKADAEGRVLECHAITGAGSHILKVCAESTADLEQLLNQIQSWPGVTQTRTHVVLSSPKETTTLPLQHLEPTNEDPA